MKRLLTAVVVFGAIVAPSFASAQELPLNLTFVWELVDEVVYKANEVEEVTGIAVTIDEGLPWPRNGLTFHLEHEVVVRLLGVDKKVYWPYRPVDLVRMMNSGREVPSHYLKVMAISAGNDEAMVRLMLASTEDGVIRAVATKTVPLTQDMQRLLDTPIN